MISRSTFAALAAMRRAAGFVIVGLAGLVAASFTPSRAAEMTLSETGSTLIYPLFKVWAQDYKKSHTGITITTAATGSGAGVKAAISGAAQIGTSDAYMSDAEIKAHPQILNVPMAISAQTVNYNVPGLNGAHIRLNGPTLAGIYAGRIRVWNDPAIATLNPGLKLPRHDIIAIHRGDASGDTFIFTQYLTFSTQSWEDTIGFGTTVAWPVVAGSVVSAAGNAGMLAALARTPFSLGYLGVSFQDAVGKAGLGTAALESYSGEFLLPNPRSIAAAAAGLGPRTPPDERLTLVNAPGRDAYPLINYEYAIVSTRQANAATAAALRQFLLWAIAPDEINARYLAGAHFIPLPAHIWVKSHDQIELIR